MRPITTIAATIVLSLLAGTAMSDTDNTPDNVADALSSSVSWVERTAVAAHNAARAEEVAKNASVSSVHAEVTASAMERIADEAVLSANEEDELVALRAWRESELTLRQATIAKHQADRAAGSAERTSDRADANFDNRVDGLYSQVWNFTTGYTTPLLEVIDEKDTEIARLQAELVATQAQLEDAASMAFNLCNDGFNAGENCVYKDMDLHESQLPDFKTLLAVEHPVIHTNDE